MARTFPSLFLLLKKSEDTTKTKYMTGLMDKAIAKVNQIELD
jgi:hypothetical protein